MKRPAATPGRTGGSTCTKWCRSCSDDAANSWPRWAAPKCGPAHIHFIVAAPGHESVTTHLFVEGDPYLESDAVFGVKETLIAPFTKCDDPGQAADLQIGSPFYLLEWDFVLARTGDAC